jgi:Ca2+-transporting ATPase
MVIYELVRLINIRGEYNIRWLSNPWLSVAMVGSFALQLMVLYVPSLSNLFGVQPILLADWLVIVIMSIGLHVAMRLVDKILDKGFEEARPQYPSSHYEIIDSQALS